MNQLKLDLIGIDGRDFRIYKTLLQTGPSSIRAIAAASGVNRGSTYESLKKLVRIGLVSYQQQTEKTKKYIAESPKKLTSLIQEQELELQTLQKSIEPHLKALEQIEAESFSLPSRIYEDDEGVAAILRDVLETVEQLEDKRYRAISSQTMRKYMYKRFPSFTKQRLAKNIHVDVIAAGEGGEIIESSHRKWLSLAEKDVERPMSYVIIYGSKLAIISITQMNVPHGIVIDDPAITRMQSLLFDQIWNQLK